MLLVIGSSNTDLVIGTPHLPAAGETILGKNFFINPGGKGANQAVAAARLGGRVKFVCKTGLDIFGNEAIQHFQNEGIDISSLLTDSSSPSGVALITVDDKGENTIVVASGANAKLGIEDLKKIEGLFDGVKLMLVQLEIPMSTVAHAIAEAAKRNIPVILNPAPAAMLPDELLKNVSVITPNETEASMLTGIDVRDEASARQAAQKLYDKGVSTVVITLGEKGALLFHNGIFASVASPRVDAVDTTAAGDIFNGAFSVAFAEGFDVVSAAKFACNAAAISVTRMGAQASAPFRHELPPTLQYTE
jgi:ribokinase